MKLTVIHGSPRKRGNTYHAAQIFLDALRKRGTVEVDEFFLPQDFPEFCLGCCSCVTRGEENCPHLQSAKPILDSMLASDALILTTPVYVMSASGGMKNFLDHYPFLFINHRPRPEFFHKKAFLISTAAGAGTKSAMKPIATCLKYWGINRVYQKGFRIFALNWEDMPPEKQENFARQLDRCAEKGTARRIFLRVRSFSSAGCCTKRERIFRSTGNIGKRTAGSAAKRRSGVSSGTNSKRPAGQYPCFFSLLR